jgi:hypothetical protein
MGETTALRSWGAGAVNLFFKQPRKYMKEINDKFRKYRQGEIRYLRLVKQIKGAVWVTSLSCIAFCCYGLLLAAVSCLALSFAGLALMAKFYHLAEQNYFSLITLHRNLREQRAEENRALGESATGLSRPLVNTPPLAEA